MACLLCDYSSNSKSNLTRHLRSRKHLKNVEVGASLKKFIAGVGFYCSMCDFETKSLRQIEQHVFLPEHEARFEEYEQQLLEEFIEELDCEGYADYEVSRDEYGCLYANVVL